MFETVDIIVFNKDSYGYETRSFFSEELCTHMLSRFTPEDIKEFIAYNNKYWGDEYIA
jgi:hypothetical protein